jgi:hypothetical protein
MWSLIYSFASELQIQPTATAHCSHQHSSSPKPVTRNSQPTELRAFTHTRPASCSSKIHPKASAPNCTQIRKSQVCVPLGVISTAMTRKGFNKRVFSLQRGQRCLGWRAFLREIGRKRSVQEAQTSSVVSTSDKPVSKSNQSFKAQEYHSVYHLLTHWEALHFVLTACLRVSYESQNSDYFQGQYQEVGPCNGDVCFLWGRK